MMREDFAVLRGLDGLMWEGEVRRVRHGMSVGSQLAIGLDSGDDLLNQPWFLVRRVGRRMA